MLFSLVLVHILMFVSAYFFGLQDLIGMFPKTADYAMFFSVVMFLPFWILLFLERKKIGGRGFLAIGIVGLLSYLYELMSINYGFPYGKFEYTEMMGGIKILGDVPLVLPLVYVPMVFAGYYALKSLDGWIRVFGFGIMLMLFDIAIDPGITASGIWVWGDSFLSGRLYGVPVQNFFGWFLTGSLSGFVLWKLKLKDLFKSLDDSRFCIWVSPISLSLAYWSGVAVREEYWLSIVVAVCLMGSLVLFKRKI
jgi:uncharacterized membrane protein